MSRILLLLSEDQARERLSNALAEAGQTPAVLDAGWSQAADLVDRVAAARPDVAVIGVEHSLAQACAWCRDLMNAAATRFIPVTVLVATRPDQAAVEQVFAAGARDVLCLDDSLSLLSARIDNMARLNYLRRTFRRQHDALVARNKELDRIFDTVTAGLAIADATGRIVRINATGSDILGGGDDDGLSEASDVYGVFGEDGRPLPVDEHPLYRAALRGISSRGEALILRRSRDPEERVLIVDAEPIHDPEGRVLGGLAVFRDATESVRMHEALRAQADELAQRNEEMEAFIYTVSHDMKSPLWTIQRYAELLHEDYADGHFDEDSGHALARIEVNAVRLTHLVEGLVQVMKVGKMELHWEPVQLEQVVRDAIRQLDAAIRQSDAQLEAQQPLPVVQGDHERLVDVFQNLIGNAIKYRKPNAPCRVQIGTIPAQSGAIHVYVRDDGIGVPESEQKRIFGLFNRLHSRDQIEGSGLGLSIVSRIVERHGGRVWVESLVGDGSTFHVVLPRSRRSGRPGPPSGLLDLSRYDFGSRAKAGEGDGGS